MRIAASSSYGRWVHRLLLWASHWQLAVRQWWACFSLYKESCYLTHVEAEQICRRGDGGSQLLLWNLSPQHYACLRYSGHSLRAVLQHGQSTLLPTCQANSRFTPTAYSANCAFSTVQLLQSTPAAYLAVHALLAVAGPSASTHAAQHASAVLQFWRFIPDEAVLHRASQFGRVIGFKRMHEDMCYLDFASEEEGVAALGGLDGYRVCSNPEYRLKVVYKVGWSIGRRKGRSVTPLNDMDSSRWCASGSCPWQDAARGCTWAAPCPLERHKWLQRVQQPATGTASRLCTRWAEHAVLALLE